MPGHMNVLLAEAECPYDQVFEMEDINAEFGQADVAHHPGANDVVNPAAPEDPRSTACRSGSLQEAKTIIVNKRSMAAGFAGPGQRAVLHGQDRMVFGDARRRWSRTCSRPKVTRG